MKTLSSSKGSTSVVPLAKATWICLLTVVGGATCIQCSPKNSKVALLTEASAPSHLIALCDTSTTFRNQLPQSLADLIKIVPELDPETCLLSVARVDSHLSEIYSRPVPQNDESFLLELVGGVKPVAGRDNTYLHTGLKWVTERVGKSKGMCVVLLSTDGFGEGMTSENWSEVRSAADALASNTNVKGVFVIGIDPRNSQRMRQGLEPLTSKVRFVSVGNLDPSEVSCLLNAGGVRQ